MTGELTRLLRVRWAVRGALALGVAASVTANILHAEQNPIAQTIAAWPPLALLLTIELISRVPVHRRALAAVRFAATAAIAGIAAWVSYWHMAGVAARYGETDAAPYLLPLSVDGLVVVASVCLVELAGRIREAEAPPPIAAEVGASVLPPAEAVSVQVSVPEPAPVLPDVEPAPTAEAAPAVTPTRRPRKAVATSAPKRSFATTQRVAAALQSDGMSVPQIAEALGITPRQARAALKPVPVESGAGDA